MFFPFLVFGFILTSNLRKNRWFLYIYKTVQKHLEITKTFCCACFADPLKKW